MNNRTRTEDALLKQGYGVQFRCDEFTLLYKPDVLSSTVKLVMVDSDGNIDTKPLSTILEDQLHEAENPTSGSV